jgi:hypothetical protein
MMLSRNRGGIYRWIVAFASGYCMGGGCIGVGLGFGKISGLEREVSCGITGDL